MDHLRPQVRFLSDDLIARIMTEAVSILEKIGLEIDNPSLVDYLLEQGATQGADSRVHFSGQLIERALSTVSEEFSLYDLREDLTHLFKGNHVYFTPGSSALTILDHEAKNSRPPVTTDYIKYARIMSFLDNLSAQSTAFIPSDVPDNASDSYRLFLSLLYCHKPVITGAFSIAGFHVMKDLLEIVRGSAENLKSKPLAVFSCCPTSPLKWSDITSQNLVDCSNASIPVEIVSMPMAGMVSPVTLTGTLIQLSAENLSGVVISQLVNPGTPVLWGGSPAAFDMRYETTPMGAIETMMIDCGNSEIGKHLKMPTQGYISLSDAKLLDAQAGHETGMGAVLATLAGINSISGPGMLDFENCHSLEKLVLDNEIAGMCLRMAQGIEPRNDFPILPLMKELLADTHLIISEHTMTNLRLEHYIPGKTIDRANKNRWLEDGGKTLGSRANSTIDELQNKYTGQPVTSDQINDLTDRMKHEVARHGMDTLPSQT